MDGLGWRRTRVRHTIVIGAALAMVAIAGYLHVHQRARVRNREAVRARVDEHIAVPFALTDYPWKHATTVYEPLARRVPVAEGYTRVSLVDRSWGQWLRCLPVLPAGSDVRAVDGSVAWPGASPFISTVIDIDVRKNQECADVICRLRAEYLKWAGKESKISFSAGDGVRISWPEWKRGVRPRYDGRRLHLERRGTPGSSRADFDRYLATMFAWCGTATIQPDLHPVPAGQEQVGDLFLRAGNSGHCVLIVDLARDGAGRTKAMFAQGWLPARSPHVVANDYDAWIVMDPTRPVNVPPWGDFRWSELRRFGGR